MTDEQLAQEVIASVRSFKQGDRVRVRDDGRVFLSTAGRVGVVVGMNQRGPNFEGFVVVHLDGEPGGRNYLAQ